MTSVVNARTLGQALAAVADGALVIAGGTDLVVGARQGKSPLPDRLVAVDRVDELRGITSTGQGITVGALTTHASLCTDTTVLDGYTALADAAALIGSPATRNVGTLGGNVMNGSPAMDTGAPLVVLDANVELRSVSGVRFVPIAELWLGPGHTSAASDEICVAIHLPAGPERSGSAYVRLEYRRAMEIAVVGAAAQVVLDDTGRIRSVAVALAAVAPTIVSVAGLDDLVGADVATVRAAVAERSSATAAPISDLRASEDYRRHTVGVMAGRAIDVAARRAAGDPIDSPANRSEGIGVAR